MWLCMERSSPMSTSAGPLWRMEACTHVLPATELEQPTTAPDSTSTVRRWTKIFIVLILFYWCLMLVFITSEIMDQWTQLFSWIFKLWQNVEQWVILPHTLQPHTELMERFNYFTVCNALFFRTSSGPSDARDQGCCGEDVTYHLSGQWLSSRQDHLDQRLATTRHWKLIVTINKKYFRWSPTVLGWPTSSLH